MSPSASSSSAAPPPVEQSESTPSHVSAAPGCTLAFESSQSVPPQPSARAESKSSSHDEQEVDASTQRPDAHGIGPATQPSGLAPGAPGKQRSAPLQKTWSL